MTIKTHGRMFTDNSVSISQLAITDGTSGQAIVTDGSGTMTFATVGAGGAVGSSTFVENRFTGDGSTTTFTLSTAAPYEESILVFVDGVAQPTTSYTLPSTTSITLSDAPATGVNIRVCHLGIASSVADNSITGAKLSMGGDSAGDVLYYNGTDYQKLGIGTAGQHLATNSGATAPEWATPATAGQVVKISQVRTTSILSTAANLVGANAFTSGIGGLACTLSHTGTSTSNRLQFIAWATFIGNATGYGAIALFSATTNIGSSHKQNFAGGKGYGPSPIFNNFAVPSTSAVSYTLRYAGEGGTVYLNNDPSIHSGTVGSGSANSAGIIIIEYTP